MRVSKPLLAVNFRPWIYFCCWLLSASLLTSIPLSAQEIAVGSKRFTESYVLGELARQLLEREGFETSHRQGLGGTVIVWEALRTGSISLYPEYTGTIKEVILKSPRALNAAEMQAALLPFGVQMTEELGFNNTYAIVMRSAAAEKAGIRRISDLQKHPKLLAGIGHETLDRKDGWHALLRHYKLEMPNVLALDHAIAYQAIVDGDIDLMDAYSTDAKLAEYDLTVLEDDLGFFPAYRAVFLYRTDLHAAALAAIRSLEGTIDEKKMISLNAEAERTSNYALAASTYFEKNEQQSHRAGQSVLSKILGWTVRHLFLVGVSMLFAILMGLPMGIRASRPGPVSQGILGFSGIVQTIPSLALLALLVPLPFFGISASTAIFALFLYSLLPIVRNTAAGLSNIPLPLRESAIAIGLSPNAQLRKVFLPMASRTILAGIKTSTIINVGTATLAALIGAGGLGEPIISGLALNDSATILQGAIPAALLAIAVQISFEFIDRLVIPKGLRLQAKASGQPPAS